MACNRPIVSTDVGDVKWLLGNEKGHFITSFEPKDVAAKIDQACRFYLNSEQTNGRKRLIKLQLDAKTTADNLVAIYNDLL